MRYYYIDLNYNINKPERNAMTEMKNACKTFSSRAPEHQMGGDQYVRPCGLHQN